MLYFEPDEQNQARGNLRFLDKNGKELKCIKYNADPIRYMQWSSDCNKFLLLSWVQSGQNAMYSIDYGAKSQNDVHEIIALPSSMSVFTCYQKTIILSREHESAIDKFDMSMPNWEKQETYEHENHYLFKTIEFNSDGTHLGCVTHDLKNKICCLELRNSANMQLLFSRKAKFHNEHTLPLPHGNFLVHEFGELRIIDAGNGEIKGKKELQVHIVRNTALINQTHLVILTATELYFYNLSILSS